MKVVVHLSNFTVRVYKQVGIFTQELNKPEADEISEYVEQHNLGIRTAWDRWKLRDSQSLIMFTLKFNHSENS